MVGSITILPLLLAVSTAATVEFLADTAIIPGAYVVEFDKNQDASVFRREAEIEFDTRLELDFELFKGVSIQLPVNQSVEEVTASLGALRSVKNIWPVKAVPPPRSEVRVLKSRNGPLTRRPQCNNPAEPYTPHAMTQVDKMHGEGITGKGVKIAIIDSGVDYMHPALGGCFGPGCLVESGYDFVGDEYNSFKTAIPDDDPQDCMGHGTHVTGVIAARDNKVGFKGAAPGASIAMYRVFGCEGGTSDDVLLAAFNRAYSDGANIITASVGTFHGWSSAPLAVAVSRIVAKGVPCTLSAGNEGKEGLFKSQSPAIGKGVTTVGSFQNTVQPVVLLESYYTVDNGARLSFPYLAVGPSDFDDARRPLWIIGYGDNDKADACQPLPEDNPDLSDYYVVVGSGDCDYEVQAENVVAKGGRFFIVYDDVPLTRPVISVDNVEGIVAVGVVPEKIGRTWVDALQAGSEITAEFIKPEKAREHIHTLPGDETQGAVSLLSSWGPSYEMEASPQLGAPGGNILSTMPLDQGGYAVRTGTSFACPFVAAAFALMAEARGTLDPKLIEGLLAVTAKPQLFQTFQDGKMAFTDFLAPPVQQGAGLLQVYDAAFSTTAIEPSNLSFNDTAHFAQTRNFTIFNNGVEDATYAISHVPTHSFFALRADGATPNGYPTEPLAEHAGLVFGQSRVTVAPGDSITIDVTAEPPRGLDLTRFPLWSGYIAVNASDGTSFSLSYQGLSGSIYNATVMGKEAAYVGISTEGPLPADATFTLPPPGVVLDPQVDPVFYITAVTNWGSRMITADLVPVTTTTSNTRYAQSIGQLAGFPLLWTTRDYWTTLWYGQLSTGEYAPAGRYKVVVKALRIFGDESKEEDWFVSETTQFQIRYEIRAA